jgi:hypothetical protein
MADQSRVFIGLLRPPKLMGLPIMYAMVWLFGSTLLFLWVQSWVVAVRGAGLAGALESRGLGSELPRCPGDHLAGNPAHGQPQAPRRRQLCPVMDWPMMWRAPSIR